MGGGSSRSAPCCAQVAVVTGERFTPTIAEAAAHLREITAAMQQVQFTPTTTQEQHGDRMEIEEFEAEETISVFITREEKEDHLFALLKGLVDCRAHKSYRLVYLHSSNEQLIKKRKGIMWRKKTDNKCEINLLKGLDLSMEELQSQIDFFEKMRRTFDFTDIIQFSSTSKGSIMFECLRSDTNSFLEKLYDSGTLYDRRLFCKSCNN